MSFIQQDYSELFLRVGVGPWPLEMNQLEGDGKWFNPCLFIGDIPYLFRSEMYL